MSGTGTPEPRALPGEEASAWGTAASGSGGSHFRPDIEGLRAIAVLAVLFYHARVPGFAGGFVGVDVFFVISGFLITGLLLREIGRTGSISLPTFYARRARRLLPAALTVILATVVLSWLLLSSLRFPNVMGDAAASALYVSNYRFAITATDYFAPTDAPSPLIHYWSLGVEEQFYLFWPLLMLAGTRLLSIRRLWIVVAAVGIGSFWASAALTTSEPAWAFYALPTRAWQLALGAIVAVTALSDRMPRSRWFLTVLEITAFTMIAGAVLLVGDGTAYPGFVSLLPTLGAAVLITTGDREESSLSRLLSVRPARWLGRISYSLYLWHWPVLILIPIAVGHDSLRVRLGLAVASIAVAALSERFIERPIRFGRFTNASSGRTLGAALACSLAVAIATMTASGALVHGSAPSVALPSLGPPPIAEPTLPPAVTSGPVPGNLVPDLATARDDLPAVYEDGCAAKAGGALPDICTYGDPAATRVVVVFGDSHAAQWLPAVSALGAARHWKVIPFVKTACPPSAVTVWIGKAYLQCDDWREWALERIAETHPDVAIVASSHGQPIVEDGDPHPFDELIDQWEAGLANTLSRVAASADRVVFIADTPRNAGDPLECLATADAVEDCTPSTSSAVDVDYRSVEARAAAEADVAMIDPAAWLCTNESCPVVFGTYLAYRDEGHLTATMATLLAARLEWELDGLGVRLSASDSEPTGGSWPHATRAEGLP